MGMNIFNNFNSNIISQGGRGTSTISWNGVTATVNASSISMSDSHITLDGKRYSLEEFKAYALGGESQVNEPKYKVENGRVVALVPIPAHKVKSGDIGGRISDESCLSQDGDCWIDYDSYVEEGSSVSGNGLHKNLIAEKNSHVSGTGNTTSATLISSTLSGTGSVIHSTLVNSRVSGTGDILSSKLLLSKASGTGSILQSTLENVQSSGTGNITHSNLSRMKVSGVDSIVGMNSKPQ